jgi:hypothetical protein
MPKKFRLDERKLRPGLAEQLAEAQAQADQFNKNKKSTEKKIQNIYKSGAKFDLEADMQEMVDNNLIDQNWKDIVAEQRPDQEEPMNSPTQMEHDALKAAGFSTEAAKMEEPKEEEQPKQESAQPQQPIMTEADKFKLVASILKERFGANAPTEQVLQQWKQTYKNIFILDLDEDNFFIYRYLNRQEWQQINANPSWSKMTSAQQEDHIVMKCLLFPRFSIEDKARLPAACFTMLSEQIQIQSMFLPAAEVARVTMKI